MKKVIAILALTLVSAFAISAQAPQTDNEGFVGYSFLRQDVKFNTTPVLRFDRNTDSHGFNTAYTRYFAGAGEKEANTVGFTADLGANFDSNNNASLVTLMGGLTAQARNSKYVQPYVRALAGAARQNVKVNNITDFTDTSASFLVGTGLNLNLKANSRYKFRVGADWINTGFMGERQNGVRLTTGLVF